MSVESLMGLGLDKMLDQTEVTAVVEAIAGAVGMTEAAAYTTAGAAVAAGAVITTTKKRFKKRRRQYTQKTPGNQREKEQKYTGITALVVTDGL